MKIFTNMEKQALVMRYADLSEYEHFIQNIHNISCYMDNSPDFISVFMDHTKEAVELVDKKLVVVWQTTIPFSMIGFVMVLLCHVMNTAVYAIHYSRNMEGLFATEGYEDEMGPQYLREQALIQTFPWLENELKEKKTEMLKRRVYGKDIGS